MLHQMADWLEVGMLPVMLLTAKVLLQLLAGLICQSPQLATTVPGATGLNSLACRYT